MQLDPVAKYNEYKETFKDLKLPLAYVDLDFLEKNISELKGRAGSLKIRAATKSVRCRHILAYLMEKHSDVFSGFMCFHPQEVRWLAEESFNDFLVAYPYQRKENFSGLGPLIKGGKKVVFMADRTEHLELLNSLGSEWGCNVEVCLDVDLSVKYPGLHFGVHRSGITGPESAKKFLKEFSKYKRLKLSAIMGYEAQIAGVGDANPFQKALNIPIRILKGLSLKTIIQRRCDVVKEVEKAGHRLDYVNGGGTGSLHLTRKDPSVTELAAGSGLYAPNLFDYYSDFQLAPASGFALEVTRKPFRNIVTCAGGGYIASGASSEDKQPKPFLPQGLSTISNEGAGEVQTPLSGDVDGLNIGDPVLFRHSKAGELCERFEELYLIRGGQIVEKVKTYRGEGKCFL